MPVRFQQSSRLLGWVRYSCKQTFISPFVILSTNLLILILVDRFKQIDTKKIIGIVLMVIESVYAVALFIILVLNGGEPSQVLFVYLLLPSLIGAAIMKWNKDHNTTFYEPRPQCPHSSH